MHSIGACYRGKSIKPITMNAQSASQHGPMANTSALPAIGRDMPRPSIEYMNARKAAKAATGGAKQDHSAKYAPDDKTDGIEIARNAIGAFSLWAALERERYLALLGIRQTEPETDIPF